MDRPGREHNVLLNHPSRQPGQLCSGGMLQASQHCAAPFSESTETAVPVPFAWWLPPAHAALGGGGVLRRL
jgi:hypothetical protein